MPKQSSDKPDMDLIRRVQQARMQHDAAARPSEVAAVYWIEAHCPPGTSAPPTPRSGQWVIETTLQEADALWAAVRQATEAGRLGYKAKVSTASRSGQSVEARTICVKTYDSADEADISRVYAALRALGITGELRYERDKD